MSYRKAVALSVTPSDRLSIQSRPPEPRSFEVDLSEITERQLECLAWVQAGKSAPDIGVILGISGRTVDSHLARLCEHLRVRTRLQAVLKAQALGLIASPAP